MKVNVQQIEVEDYASAEESSNDSGDFNISLQVPGNIQIRMVDATQLGDYEIWFTGASLILSICVAFATACIQETETKIKSIFSGVGWLFFVIFIFCFGMTLYKRHSLRKKGKTVKLYTSKVVQKF